MNIFNSISASGCNLQDENSPPPLRMRGGVSGSDHALLRVVVCRVQLLPAALRQDCRQQNGSRLLAI